MLKVSFALSNGELIFNTSIPEMEDADILPVPETVAEIVPVPVVSYNWPDVSPPTLTLTYA
jgi:hypothetical protein